MSRVCLLRCLQQASTQPRFGSVLGSRSLSRSWPLSVIRLRSRARSGFKVTVTDIAEVKVTTMVSLSVGAVVRVLVSAMSCVVCCGTTLCTLQLVALFFEDPNTVHLNYPNNVVPLCNCLRSTRQLINSHSAPLTVL